ncbi:c-type cytochrome [Flocculibacter collagenilyticus]|uniref:c-type cytochrome n=1 Tax=Flocculibacter collagenilyticus TaxID=2744479 RepID=UPI0018F2B644|nr:cytochrome c5 family protein [Flocculibacter collagenilyticus]
MKKLSVALALVISASSVFAVAAEDKSKDDAIKKRIQPVGQVYVEGETAAAAPAAPTGPRSGGDVFQASCFACHGTGAMGAPKKGDSDAWAPRLEKGMDVLVDHAINGFNAMPPKGTCMSCSDDEIKAAIDFMLEGA